MRINLLAAVVVLVILTPGRAATGLPLHEVPFQLDAQGRIIIRVSLAAGEALDFLLDTGPTGSAVSAELSGRLGLRPVARAMVLSPAGSRMRELVPLGRLTVGPAVADHILAAVMEPGAFSRAGLNVDGILGQDFLARFDFTIDYRRRRLVWDDFAPGSHGEAPTAAIALVSVEARLIAVLPPVNGRPPLRLVPDTGASALVLYDTQATTQMGLMPLEGGYELGGLMGRRDVRAVRVSDLRLGNVRLRNQPAVLLPSPSEQDVVADGLLPLHLFACVAFRPKEGVLLLWK